MALSCGGSRFIELRSPGPHSSSRILPARNGGAFALPGRSACEFRFLLSGRSLKCCGCAEWRIADCNSDFGSRRGCGESGRATTSRCVCAEGVAASLGFCREEDIAAASVSRARGASGVSVVERSLGSGGGREVTASDAGGVRSSSGLERVERCSLDCLGSGDAGVASLQYLGEDERISGGNSSACGRGTGTAVSVGFSFDECLEYYVPEIGHRVLGVVVAGSRTTFDVDIGAAKLGELKASKLFPLDRFQVKHNKWIFPEELGAEGASDEFSKPPHGRACLVYDAEVFAFEDPALFIIDIGTVLEMVVVGESSSGNAVLSARRAAERIAWDRVKQIKELKQPIQIEVVDFNSSGIIAKVEGLRAFLPLKEFIDRPKTSEEYIGRKLWVVISFVDEVRHNLVLSERKAWLKRNLQPGSLHNGTVIGILPYGVRVKVNRTNIMGLIHISNIAHGLIENIADVFEVGEQIKMMVAKSDALNTISFSTADLESESGLMLKDKQRVFQEAEQTAYAWWIEYRRSKPSHDNDAEDFSYEETPEPIANLDWLDFGQEKVSFP